MKKFVFILVLSSFLLMGFHSEGFAKKEKQTKEEKKAAKIAKKEASIEKSVGTKANWKPAAFKDIRKGMTCAEVAQVFKRLDCNTRSPFKIANAGLGTVSQYKFYFSDGKLYSATIIFGTRLLDEKTFNAALFNVVQKKWGPIENTANIRWKNHNYENVTLKYNQTHWELEVQMPVIDPGDINLGVLDEANLRTNLQAFFGGRDNSVPAFFTTYKYNMPWQDVKGIHPDLNYDPSKSLNYCYVSISNHPLLAGLKLRIDSGYLEAVSAIFHWQIPRDLFKQVSFEVMRDKYGTDIKDEMLLKDRMGLYIPAKVYLYREWKTDCWDINMDLPKTATGVPVKAPMAKTAAPTLKTTAAAPVDTGNITGDWKLVAASLGGKTSAMNDGTERKIEFTPQQMMIMKENGKVVVKNFYKTAGSGLYFTAVKGGKAIKKFATVISCSTNRLVLVIEGQSPQMIFEKQ